MERRQVRRRRRAQEEQSELIENVVEIKRTATVVKGGRRFSFGGLVVVGDGQGRVGFGYGKANEVPTALTKGTDEATRSMVEIPLKGTTIPHEVLGKFASSRVLLRPASPGTGVIAGGAVRAVVEAAGVKDVLTKSLGSHNALNLVKATMNALSRLRSRETVEALRGVDLSDVSA